MDPLSLELEGSPVPDVAPDVFFVDQNLMDCAPGPRPPQIRGGSTCIEQPGDLALGLSFINEGAIDPPDSIKLFWWAGNQDNTVGLYALVLAPCEHALLGPALVDEHAP